MHTSTVLQTCYPPVTKVMNILVIDDNYEDRIMISSVLTDEGYSVTEACNGDIGIKEWDRCGFFDVVITEMIMAVKEGIETIQELRKRSSSTKIIAVSGKGPKGPELYLHLGKIFGADATIPKPFGRQQLLDIIDSL